MGRNFFLLLDITFYHPKINFKLVASHNISLFLFSTDLECLKKQMSFCQSISLFSNFDLKTRKFVVKFRPI